MALCILRALIPYGFMPDTSGQHILTICSGAETLSILVDQNNTPIKNTENNTDPKHFSAEICPFSFLSSALLHNPPDKATFIPAPILTATGMTAIIRVTIPSLSLDESHHSRAPPQFS